MSTASKIPTQHGFQGSTQNGFQDSRTARVPRFMCGNLWNLCCAKILELVLCENLGARAVCLVQRVFDDLPTNLLFSTNFRRSFQRYFNELCMFDDVGSRTWDQGPTTQHQGQRTKDQARTSSLSSRRLDAKRYYVT